MRVQSRCRAPLLLTTPQGEKSSCSINGSDVLLLPCRCVSCRVVSMVCVCRPAWSAFQTSTASHSAAPTSGRTGEQEKHSWHGGYPWGGLGRTQSDNHDFRGLESALARLLFPSPCPGHSMPVSAGLLAGVCVNELMYLRSTAQVHHSVAQHTRITQCQLLAIWVTRTNLTPRHLQ
jgi:hypothetical protein